MKNVVCTCLCFAALLVMAGCGGGSGEPVPVTTDEDKIAEYEAMIAGEEAEAQENQQEEVAP